MVARRPTTSRRAANSLASLARLGLNSWIQLIREEPLCSRQHLGLRIVRLDEAILGRDLQRQFRVAVAACLPKLLCLVVSGLVLRYRPD